LDSFGKNHQGNALIFSATLYPQILRKRQPN
jgi:hypothetical protein